MRSEHSAGSIGQKLTLIEDSTWPFLANINFMPLPTEGSSYNTEKWTASLTVEVKTSISLGNGQGFFAKRLEQRPSILVGNVPIRRPSEVKRNCGGISAPFTPRRHREKMKMRTRGSRNKSSCTLSTKTQGLLILVINLMQR